MDAIDTFNTFQGQTRSMLEKMGYLTVTNIELDKFQDKNPTIIAPGVKGVIPVQLLQKTSFYKEFLET